MAHTEEFINKQTSKETAENGENVATVATGPTETQKPVVLIETTTKFLKSDVEIINVDDSEDSADSVEFVDLNQNDQNDAWVRRYSNWKQAFAQPSQPQNRESSESRRRSRISPIRAP